MRVYNNKSIYLLKKKKGVLSLHLQTNKLEFE